MDDSTSHCTEHWRHPPDKRSSLQLDGILLHLQQWILWTLSEWRVLYQARLFACISENFHKYADLSGSMLVAYILHQATGRNSTKLQPDWKKLCLSKSSGFYRPPIYKNMQVENINVTNSLFIENRFNEHCLTRQQNLIHKVEITQPGLIGNIHFEWHCPDLRDPIHYLLN